MTTHEKEIEMPDTGIASPSASRVRTFEIAELLETILAELPPRDLLLVQRVCKDWQAAIIASKKLQVILFFRPISNQTLAYGQGSSAIWHDSEDLENDKPVKPFWNPMLEPMYDSLAVSRTNTFYDRLPNDKWKKPEASWRKMLRSQPPSYGYGCMSYAGIVGCHEDHVNDYKWILQEGEITASAFLERLTHERKKRTEISHLPVSVYQDGFWREDELRAKSEMSAQYGGSFAEFYYGAAFTNGTSQRRFTIALHR